MNMQGSRNHRMDNTTPLSSNEIFERWLRFRSRDPFNPLTPTAARPYRSIWRSWCRHLARHAQPTRQPDLMWIDAQAIDLQRFLHTGGIQPARHGKYTASEISRHRYWRVIAAVYEFAKDHGLVTEVPTSKLDQHDTPINERSRGQIFHSNDWQKIGEAIPAGLDRWATRNRAILYLLMDAALTPAETATLRGRQLVTQNRHIQINLDGPRQAQKRVIELGTAASKYLRDWIDVRSDLNEPKNEPKDAVFLTQKGNRIVPTGIYHLTSETISKALVGHDALLSHTGPQVLRNTRLTQWLNNGVPMPEVIRRAGFKDVKSFRGIREHIDPSVMPEIKTRSKLPSH